MMVYDQLSPHGNLWLEKKSQVSGRDFLDVAASNRWPAEKLKSSEASGGHHDHPARDCGHAADLCHATGAQVDHGDGMAMGRGWLVNNGVICSISSMG